MPGSDRPETARGSGGAAPVSESAPAYPAQWESDVVLADGGTVHVRPIRPGDAGALTAFHARLSPESIYFRFFSPHPRLSRDEVERFTRVDYVDRMALVAELGDDLIAISRYDRLPGTTDAEVAFVVEDAHQGRGLGTILLEHLAAAGCENGIERFVADVLPQNRRMLEVFRDTGFKVERGFEDGVVHLGFPIEATRASIAAVFEREHRAAVRSIARLLAPRSIAVIGASRDPRSAGGAIFRNLLAGGFQGPVYPVNRAAAHVSGVRAWPDVEAVPDEVDLAVIAVPADAVEEVVSQCARARVRSLVVVSAGFAETGPEGRAREERLVGLAHRHGMRLVGPNCLGILNTARDVRLNATFSDVVPAPGPIAFAAQSGALGIAVLAETARLGLGVSSFVSMGNKADVSGNDLLQYWQEDRATGLIVLYLESFGNPRKFARVAQRAARRKPVVAVKAGRTRAGSRAASSHTAALAGSAVAVRALFQQAGVIQVETLQELFEAAQLLSTQPLPEGRRVALVGNSGGPAIMAADACESGGLEVPELAAETQERLRRGLPLDASLRNPVDLVGTARAEHYERALRIVLADPHVDAVVAIFTPTAYADAEEVARAIASAAAAAEDAHRHKPVLANFLAVEQPPRALRAGAPGGRREPAQRSIPCFAFPESAPRALARAADHAEWRKRPRGSVPRLRRIRKAEARLIIVDALQRRPQGAWLAPDAAGALLEHYGIPVAPSRLAADAEGAVEAADALGYPVALKAASAEIVHKTERGAVRLSLGSAADVHKAFEELAGRLGDAMGGALVQRMVGPGVETIIGVTQDPSFGPLVLFGMGGVTAELLQDRALRILPLTDLDARELVRSLRSSPLLFGYRGSPAADVAALESMLLRVGRLADDLPEVAEMDLNPVVASPDGATAVDVKVHVRPWRRHPELALRRLG